MAELLENRQLLSGGSPQISDVTSAHITNDVAFNTVSTGYSGAGPSRIETVTITDTGGSPLTFGSGAFSVVNDPTTTANAANFTIFNSGSLPSSLAPGASATVQLKYSATIVGLQSALLQIKSNDPVTPTLTINLHGIGTPGTFGVAEPSLAQVVRAFNIPTIIGAGPNDVNINVQKYPINPDPSSEEVSMQRMVVAGPGPVTITPIASFSSATYAVSRIGYYTPGDPNASTELFYVPKADAQTVSPAAIGATTFDPGSAPFSLYGTFPGTSTPTGAISTHYSEDSLNTLDPTHERKIRFFPLKTSNGTVVPNSYVVAMEDFNDPTQYNSFINFVGIISNVKAAPNATQGSTPSSPTGNNPPVMGVQENETAPGSTTLVFNTIKTRNVIVPDVVHDTNTITINNTGDQPLVINSLTLSDATNWTLVNPPAPGTSIAGRGSLIVTIKFIATSNPPHTTNETNDVTSQSGVSSVNAGGVWSGTLTINSTDAINPTRTVNLAGYWQIESEHEDEPNITTMTNLMFGYSTDTTGSASKQGTEYLNNGNTPVTYGSEVDPSTDQGLLVAADPGQPVSLIEAAAFHQQYLTMTAEVGMTEYGIITASESGTTVTITTTGHSPFTTGETVTIAGILVSAYDGTFTITGTPTTNTITYTDSTSGLATSANVTTAAVAGWYPSGGGTKLLYKDLPNNSQAMFPLLTGISSGTYSTTFNPTGAFGINLDGEDSQDAKNAAVDAQFNTSGHALRFFPAMDSNGNVIPNTWIVGLDYRNYLGPNSDYQDLYMVLTNATFEAIPPTPIDLQASQGTSGVNLQWVAMTGATGYNIYQVINGTSVKLNSNPVTTASYVDSTAPAGSAVTYQVFAVNSAGTQSMADSASINLSGTLPAPTAPTILQADGSSGTQVSLSWTAPAGATGYNVQREDPGQSSFTTIAPGLTTTSFVDTNVTAGLSYVYQVQATNASGPSPFSSPVSAPVATIQTAPPVPAITQVDGSSGTQVVVTWGASTGATSYNIQVEGPNQSSFSVIGPGLTTTTFTDTNVTSGSTYMYEVQAQNGAGMSAFSAPASVTVATIAQPPPAAPSNVQSSTATADSVVLTWDATLNATSYDVQREDPGQSSFSNIVSGLASPTYTDTGVTAGQIYNYQIIAVDAGGPSSPSSTVTAAVPSPLATLNVVVGKNANSFVKFTTTTGALVTIKLNGAGTATVNFAADSISQSASGKGVLVSGTNIAIAGITTTGTTAGTSLSVSTRRGSNSVNIGAISVDASLNSITAPTAALIGTLAVTGSVNRITLGSATAATLAVGGKLGNFLAKSVTGVTLTAGGVIGNITAANWSSNHAITAASINSIRLKGNAQLTVAAGFLRSLNVQGELHDSVFTLSAGGVQDLANLSAFSIVDTVLDTTGNIGTISASMLLNTQIYAGTGASGDVAFPPVGSAFAATATIANINLKKKKGVFSDTNSSIAASQIKHLNLGNVQFSNGGIPFGVEALSINVLSAANPSVKPFTFHNLTTSAIVSTDFSARNITPEDFQIEII